MRLAINIVTIYRLLEERAMPLREATFGLATYQARRTVYSFPKPQNAGYKSLNPKQKKFNNSAEHLTKWTNDE